MEKLLDTKEIWNFSYGSNMSSSKLTDSRGIIPMESACGILKDYRLSFQFRGFPCLEPGFAMVEPYDGAEVHGVCHLMSTSDYIYKLLATEGGGGILSDGYVSTEVEVILYDGRKIIAHTLEGRGNVVEKVYHIHPSQRYLNLLNDGKNYGLNSHYVDWINEHKPIDRGYVSVTFALVSILIIFVILLPILLPFWLIKKVGYPYPNLWLSNIIQIYILWPFLTIFCCNSGVDLDDLVPIFKKDSTIMNFILPTSN